MTTAIPFTKMVATGNDFVIVDTLHNHVSSLAGEWPQMSQRLCDRHRGIGADGVLVLEPSRVAHVKMRVFNPDGSEAEMCGNGARCAARFVQTWPTSPGDTVVIETAGGMVSATVHGSQVRMQMPNPHDLRFDLNLEVGERMVRAAYLNTGVPHLVVPVSDLDHVDVNSLGRALRQHRMFLPSGANVNFLQADEAHPDCVRIRTYERGVEAETLACGTGAAASAVVHGFMPAPVNATESRRIQVQTRSGDLLTISFTVTMDGASGRVTDVVLEGKAHRVYEGTWFWQPGGDA